MTLTPPATPRRRVHTRSIRIEGYQREDGLWDIEGRVTDVKDDPFDLYGAVREPGDPVHDMWLRITVDDDLRIVDAQASMEATPFPGTCPGVVPEYRKLIGVSIGLGFRRAVSALLGGVHGCVHVNELLWSVATGAIQTLAARRRELREPDQKPFQIDGCHAWSSLGPIVERYYPLWHRQE